MDYVKAAISPLNLVTPAGMSCVRYLLILQTFQAEWLTDLSRPGLNHPYYSYKPSTYQTVETMFARITSYPPLGE